MQREYQTTSSRGLDHDLAPMRLWRKAKKLGDPPVPESVAAHRKGTAPDARRDLPPELMNELSQ